MTLTCLFNVWKVVKISERQFLIHYFSIGHILNAHLSTYLNSPPISQFTCLSHHYVYHLSVSKHFIMLTFLPMQFPTLLFLTWVLLLGSKTVSLLITIKSLIFMSFYTLVMHVPVKQSLKLTKISNAIVKFLSSKSLFKA